MPTQLHQRADGELHRADRGVPPLGDEPAQEANGRGLELLVAGRRVEADELQRVLEGDLDSGQRSRGMGV